MTLRKNIPTSYQNLKLKPHQSWFQNDKLSTDKDFFKNFIENMQEEVVITDTNKG